MEKLSQKNFYNQGITLIALVLTVIVLLILTGISIVTLVGENGILMKATVAKEKYEIATAKEALEVKLSEILIEKLGEKDLNYLDTMKIDGYDVSLSKIGRIVTMTKNNIPYIFLVDSEYNIIDLNNLNIINGYQGIYEDYIDNLLYKVNFKNLLNNTSEGIKFEGEKSELIVDDTNTYATFNGKTGISIDANEIDSEEKLIGTTNKTISLWYRMDGAKNVKMMMIIGDTSINGGGCVFHTTNNNNIRLGVGYEDLIVDINPETRFDNKWHSLIGVFENGNTIKLYYDGVRFSNTGGKYHTLNSQLFIGYSHYDSQRYYWEGDLSDIRIYSSALNDDQVYQIYKYGKEILKNY